jgi:adenine-specific DNA methylase
MPNNNTRKWIAERADLVAAVRLPNTAFKENAGTEVVTDIIVLRKRGKDEHQMVLNGSKQVLKPWQIPRLARNPNIMLITFL